MFNHYHLVQLTTSPLLLHVIAIMFSLLVTYWFISRLNYFMLVIKLLWLLMNFEG
ncbi:hypothetical protein RIR_e18628_A0A2N0NF46_9GLOM [Rhizophagus irregularis DAOM 181602=DAOM 197198]|nr:hypothetical protein RIR_e18628_A0A2N0NF46_9GLOM [Rhizophagus irregularis DAOM 181602=DAOM 197198]